MFVFLWNLCSTHLISRLYVFIAGADLGWGAYGDAVEFSVRCAQEFGDGSFSRFVRKRSPFRVLGEIRKILFNRYLMIRRLLWFVVCRLVNRSQQNEKSFSVELFFILLRKIIRKKDYEKSSFTLLNIWMR